MAVTYSEMACYLFNSLCEYFITSAALKKFRFRDPLSFPVMIALYYGDLCARNIHIHDFPVHDAMYVAFPDKRKLAVSRFSQNIRHMEPYKHAYYISRPCVSWKKSEVSFLSRPKPTV